MAIVSLETPPETPRVVISPLLRLGRLQSSIDSIVRLRLQTFVVRIGKLPPVTHSPSIRRFDDMRVSHIRSHIHDGLTHQRLKAVNVKHPNFAMLWSRLQDKFHKVRMLTTRQGEVPWCD